MEGFRSIRSMSPSPDLQQILDLVAGKVNPQKLEKLKQKLEEALGGPLSTHLVEDPIIIRRRLVELLRREGTSQGVVQSLEQFYMGIIRRASIERLLPPPPEGPWTREWQSVLNT